MQPPCSKHSQLKLVVQSCVQLGFEYLKGWTLHSLSGKLVPVLNHAHSKKVFPDVQTEFSVFQFVPIAYCPVTVCH